LISLQGLPRLYGAVLIGDDNFLNIAGFNLGYDITYQQQTHRRVRRCGYCVSGLKIADATEIIKNMNDSVKHVLINVGSVDIAEGRALIEMISDLHLLLRACEVVGVQPILTTLPPIPNHMLQNKRDNHIGFNRYLREKIKTDYSVIDLNIAMVTAEHKTDWTVYQQVQRKLSGSRESLVMWNNHGRNRIIQMIIKNIGHALFFTNYLGELM
jgi:hypothetical protein